MAWIFRRLAGALKASWDGIPSMGSRVTMMLAASGKLEYKPNKYIIYIYNYKYVNAMLDLVNLVA